jgi:hypothetical protein
VSIISGNGLVNSGGNKNPQESSKINPRGTSSAPCTDLEDKNKMLIEVKLRK